MDLSALFSALLMGIVEGITEFLPISSTGHLILAGSLLDFTGEKAKVFEVAIQTGAMLAVIWEYRARFGGLVTRIGHGGTAQVIRALPPGGPGAPPSARLHPDGQDRPAL
jgi:undecaprenyl-diphosphatase